MLLVRIMNIESKRLRRKPDKVIAQHALSFEKFSKSLARDGFCPTNAKPCGASFSLATARQNLPMLPVGDCKYLKFR